MNILALIKSDLLITFGPQIMDWLAGITAAQGDPVKLGLAFIKFEGDLFAAGPQALAGLEAQISEALQVKLQGLVDQAKQRVAKP